MFLPSKNPCFFFLSLCLFACFLPLPFRLTHTFECIIHLSVLLLCVPERVHVLGLVLPYRTFALLQGLTSAFRERALQQLHQHRTISTSVHRLPHFQKSSPDLESIHWVAQSRDHLDCSIFRVHHQHERKLLHSFLSNIAHFKRGQSYQRIRFHICQFRTELFINRKRLRLVANSEVNWFSSVFLCILWNWSSCRSCFIDHHLLTSAGPADAQSLNKISPSKSSDAAAPEYEKLPGSVNAKNKLRYHARTCDSVGRVFLSR